MNNKTVALTISKSDYDAVIFDLDGVITRTAKVHARAWKQLFDDYLRERSAKKGENLSPFDWDSDYRNYVDGKPRYEGVRSFLLSRGIDLPHGSPDDETGKETICSLGNKKNLLFHQALKENGVEVYEAAVDFVRMLKSKGFKTAIVSSSKNCASVLRAAEIEGLFDVKVDGIDAEKRGLKGKPDPDIFLDAAKQLGVAPERAMVVEDALSGVEAGRRGQFGCVIGVDRTGHALALKKHGADIVVKNLSEIAVSEDVVVLEQYMDELSSALDSMEEIGKYIKEKRAAVFLDYDGTLTPIVARPELAVLSDKMKETVEQLGRYCTVAIMSGRDLQDVRKLVGIDRLFYAGSHGFDITGPRGVQMEFQKGKEFLPVLDRVEQELKKQLGEVDGVLIERKKFSIAVHYRNVKEEMLGTVKRVVDRVVEQTKDLRLSHGKKVYDLQPQIEWNKGKALLWLLDGLDLNHPDVVPFYIGDDTTDEDAFRALKNRGIGIVVKEGNRKTAARYVLGNPDHVQTFLKALMHMVKGGN